MFNDQALAGSLTMTSVKVGMYFIIYIVMIINLI